MHNQKRTIGIIVALAVVTLLVFVGIRFAEKSQAPTMQPQIASTPSVPPSQNILPETPIPQTPIPHVPQVSPKPRSSTMYPMIPLTSPIGSERWVIGEQHVISWNTDTGVVSGIYLVDAVTGNTVGWITSSNAPHQTSYTWGTNEVYLSRGNPLKKDIGPGTYTVKIRFDAPNRPDSVSNFFSIIYPNQAQIPSHTVVLQNYLFSPSTLTATKGDRIAFENRDSITHSLKLTNFSPFVVAAGQSFTFDTSILSPGPYTFYSMQYSSMVFTLTVK